MTERTAILRMLEMMLGKALERCHSQGIEPADFHATLRRVQDAGFSGPA